jgi:hypothetical protein
MIMGYLDGGKKRQTNSGHFGVLGRRERKKS